MKIHKSISHFTAKEQNNLHCIKKKIVGYVEPLIIFCYGSKVTESIERSCFATQRRMEDWHFSCDLLIVVPDNMNTGNETLAEIERLAEPFGKVKATICTLELLLRELSAGNFFFAWVRRSAIILYEKNNTIQQLPPAIHKTENFQKQANEFFAANPDMAKLIPENLLSEINDIPAENLAAVVEPSAEDKQTESITNYLPTMTHEPQDFYPKLLSPEELANPYIVAFSFYTSYDLTSARKTIANWMDGAYKPVNWSKYSPADLLYFYDLVIRLIEAAWLINQMDNDEREANLLSKNEEDIDLMNPVLFCMVLHKDSAWEYFPRSLSRKEFINPYKVFPKFFKFSTLAEWKQELYNLLHLALSGDGIDRTGDTINVLGYKKHLDKLMDAFHLIRVREFRKGYDDILANGETLIKGDKEQTTNNEKGTASETN